ncbi:MAG: AAA family ATPase [Prolixibacteraceae bacterium]|nr:AAA family ATPase [Prolixibacteraceae bacterium]
MEHFIDHISIKNFKSIRDLKIEGLKRINLFIGKPNVGKSNILEAFGVFSLPFLKFSSNKNISNFIRMENYPEIFYDGIVDNRIEIVTNKYNAIINIENKVQLHHTSLESEYININIETTKGKFLIQCSAFKEPLKAVISSTGKEELPIKKYDFKTNVHSKKNGNGFLVPPFGSNLMKIIEISSALKKEITELFNEYGLNLVFDKSSSELKVAKPPKNNEIFLIPFNSVADTLQRVIFYKTAIASNTNSVLIFEEPEAHAFPPYIVHITQEIVESKTNQFMISTHSPYVLNHFVENAKDDLAIFMVDYKNGKTVLNCLKQEDIDHVQKYGIDLFTNYETFLK